MPAIPKTVSVRVAGSGTAVDAVPAIRPSVLVSTIFGSSGVNVTVKVWKASTLPLPTISRLIDWSSWANGAFVAEHGHIVNDRVNCVTKCVIEGSFGSVKMLTGTELPSNSATSTEIGVESAVATNLNTSPPMV